MCLRSRRGCWTCDFTWQLSCYGRYGCHLKPFYFISFIFSVFSPFLNEVIGIPTSKKLCYIVQIWVVCWTTGLTTKRYWQVAKLVFAPEAACLLSYSSYSCCHQNTALPSDCHCTLLRPSVLCVDVLVSSTQESWTSHLSKCSKLTVPVV